MGAAVIDTDTVGHEVLYSDKEVWHRIVDTFGKDILTSSGDIDRGRLADIVFHNRKLLSKLNAITHPRIYQKVKTVLEGLRRKKRAIAIVEVPLLPEGGWESIIDELWVTTAPRSTILSRLKERGLSRRDSIARIASQVPPQEQLDLADVGIDTDCSLEELRARVADLWKNLTSEKV
jgi:dephospho-CoA kinase